MPWVIYCLFNYKLLHVKSFHFGKLHLPAKYFGDTSMGDSELSGDVTRPDSLMGQLHNTLPHHIRQGTAIDKDSSKLIHSTMTWNDEKIAQNIYDISINVKYKKTQQTPHKIM